MLAPWTWCLVFRTDRGGEKASLHAASAPPELSCGSQAFALTQRSKETEEPFCQPWDKGIVGMVATEGKMVNLAGAAQAKCRSDPKVANPGIINHDDEISRLNECCWSGI